MAVTTEQLLDKIAEGLITNMHVIAEGTELETLQANQHTIKQGIIQSTRETNDKLILWQQDVKANSADILAVNPDGDETTIATTLDSWIAGAGDIDISQVNIIVGDSGQGGEGATVGLQIDGGSVIDITNLLTQGEGNPLNISQFIMITDQQTTVDPSSAEEFLDSTIYELLPDTPTRQKRIDNFFKEYNVLKGEIPNWYQSTESEFNPPEDYEEMHDISIIQDYPGDALIEEQDSFITRLNTDANDTNVGKTLQSLRDDLNEFLRDIDEDLLADTSDERPVYENKSDGYLKIRNLNQGIVVRKQEGDGVGLENIITLPAGTHGPSDATLGLHPQVKSDAEGSGPSYLMDGFTITMWVKFLDKTSHGTLFNYGNPLRGLDPKGFVLDTYVLNKNDTLPGNDGLTWGEAAEATTLFSDGDSERFIRLVVYDHITSNETGKGERLYDSRLGIPGLPKEDNTIANFGIGYEAANYSSYEEGYELNLLAHQRVPIDFNEWYFIVANYNPLVYDSSSTYNTTWSEHPDYWRGNIDPDPQVSDPSGTISYSHYSGYGNKCKVEIISKSDLLRARGFQS